MDINLILLIELFQVSLSMTRIVPGASNQELTYHQLALNGISDYLDYLQKNNKMEFVSLVSAYLI